ncbi:MAG: LacI family DNA-binding transcriptional regulator [Longimonas sp.]|uniref:LacI family DNA-binding transcriptional regulator n=1 Tax=Longimonas sp. TaxID=2039626 RepID=UPI0039754204
MGVTIRDVAKVAGVSATTVSRVFNHSELVTDETQERVRTVAQDMGYRPNATAQSLSHGRTQVVGVIVPAPHGEFFSEIIRGIDEVAQKANHYLLISSSHYSLSESEAALDALRGRADGLLVMTTHVETQSKLLDDMAIDVPVVFMNSPLQSTSYDTFDIENYGGAYKATSHLIERGYERIGIILGPPESHDVRERTEGYRDALTEAGLDPDAQPVIEGDFTRASGYKAGEKIPSLNPHPDAFFSCNDYMAIGAMAALQKEGLRIPEDIAMVGFDDIPSARYNTPALTTVRVPVHDLGRQAARRLFDLLQGGTSTTPRQRVLPSELVVRSST